MFSQSPITATTDTLQAILNAIPNPVFLKDRAHRVVLVNDAFCQLLGRPRTALLNTIEEHLPKEQLAVFWSIDDRVFETGVPNENEEVLSDSTGALHVILTRKRLMSLPTPDGEKPFILATISDVTAYREAERRARYMAEHDVLTGLANRTQFTRRLEGALENAGRTGDQVALLLLDLDGFKAVNDGYGHPAGDDLLRVIAQRLAGLVRPIDTVARLGGDEFCIIQTNVRSADDAYGLADRALSTVCKSVTVDSRNMAVSASIGIALFPLDGTTPAVLLQRADRALYTVKRTGRHGYWRTSAMPADAPTPEWDMASAFRTALEREQLTLEFQPLVAMADGNVRGFEALARWQDPDHGRIDPEVFIPVAESAGVMEALSAWVLHKACATAISWPDELQVAVNIAASQLVDTDLPALVSKALAASGLNPSRLELEIKESALLGSAARVFETVSALKALGVGLALDDFGAGCSSFAALQNFQFNRIKIDRSFVANIDSDVRSLAIIRAVLSVAQSLNVPVTAEGVELREQFLALQRMGCAEVQGYYVGRPSPQASPPDRKDPLSTRP